MGMVVIQPYILVSIFKAKENQDKFPTLYWLPKLHKTYKASLIVNYSFCTITELSKLLTSCYQVM